MFRFRLESLLGNSSYKHSAPTELISKQALKLKRMLIQDKWQIARNLTAQLWVFAIGAVRVIQRPSQSRSIASSCGDERLWRETLMQLMLDHELFRNE